jgi:hypothetical protein
VKRWIESHTVSGWPTRFRADLVVNILDMGSNGCSVAITGRAELLHLAESADQVTAKIDKALAATA